jgi:hypothetical protein
LINRANKNKANKTGRLMDQTLNGGRNPDFEVFAANDQFFASRRFFPAATELLRLETLIADAYDLSILFARGSLLREGANLLRGGRLRRRLPTVASVLISSGSSEKLGSQRPLSRVGS